MRDFTSKLKLAYVTENYRYCEEIRTNMFLVRGGKTNIKCDFGYSPAKTSPQFQLLISLKSMVLGLHL
jgi:hypothetical protein